MPATRDPQNTRAVSSKIFITATPISISEEHLRCQMQLGQDVSAGGVTGGNSGIGLAKLSLLLWPERSYERMAVSL